ncbi:metallophosphoesterase [Pseudomonas sp. LRF_L74]|uniref:metallophosphoesterase n=1 Tax=Pseudomonas sp. LRF_L74 TaxID=3369422 RepID=UPI003F601DCA
MIQIQRFERNTRGHDFAVGDIHGHFRALMHALDRIGFDRSIDRLFSVGDLVDRGPDSPGVGRWLDQPWFHAVRGNHEQMAIQAAQEAMEQSLYLRNGGGWFLDLSSDEQQAIAKKLADLPLAIEVDTPAGLVGLVHADIPYDN